MATGAAGKVTDYSDPPVVNNGTVVTPVWMANMTANVNRLIDGNGVTLKALQIDGTGGNSVTAASGTVQGNSVVATSTVGGTTVPTPAFTAGALYKDTALFAMGFISANALAWGVNIATFTHTSTGVYTVTFNTALTNAIRAVIIASPVGVSQIVQGTISSTTTAVLGNTNLTGTAQDNNLYFVLFGS